MLGLLEKAGCSVVQEPEEADLLLVNTCGFIGSAVEEAVDEILQLVEYKQQDRKKQLVVTGCLVKRYGDELRKELPEVDLFVGTEDIGNIVALVRGASAETDARLVVTATPFLMDNSLPRRISTPAHRAYVKITEGCANRCTYCLIPSIRGRLRSRTVADLAAEAQKLAASGVRELTLVAQDLLAYGMDQGRMNLQGLLEELLRTTEIPWLRLLYLHPARLDRRFLEFMAVNSRILPYLDIPLQHVSDRILKRMGRPYGRDRLEKLIADARQILPEAAIRTTLMVGFPGETEAEFTELLDFLEGQRLHHVGVFAYSNEEGCQAANLPDQCSESLKEERRRQLMELQAEISSRRLQGYIGSKVKVLVEGFSRETDLLVEGRAWFQAPDIDGCVYISSGISDPGAIVDVSITDSHYYDLVGEIPEERE
jgi:ribosomal protein S12 methylthiotransferase